MKPSRIEAVRSTDPSAIPAILSGWRIADGDIELSFRAADREVLARGFCMFLSWQGVVDKMGGLLGEMGHRPLDKVSPNAPPN